MKNKLLILFFLAGFFQNLLFAKVDSTFIPSKAEINTIVDALHLDTLDKDLNRLAEKIISVPSDTGIKKPVLFDSNFKNKYIDDEDFDYFREEADLSFFSRLKIFFIRLFKKLLGIAPTENNSNITLIVYRIVSGLIILTVLFFIIKYILNNNGRWIFDKKNESISIDINNTEQLIESADFGQMIAEIEKQGNTRQSIRLYYLWLLKSLKDKELIDWLPEKTNADYLYELKDETLKKQFAYLSYLYDYIWYGEFSIIDTDYIHAKNAFLNFLKLKTD